MLRGMLFVDHMNFDIAVQDLFEGRAPKLSYSELFPGIVTSIKDVTYLKTFIFAPAPDEFLMQTRRWQGYYNWMLGFRNTWYMDVIFGRLLSHQRDPDVEMDPNDWKTFIKEEKGTDVNLASHLLIKAFNNSFDIAFVLSADSDYIHVYQTLKHMGKLVVLVTVEGQSTKNTAPETDFQIQLSKRILESYKREDIEYHFTPTI